MVKTKKKNYSSRICVTITAFCLLAWAEKNAWGRGGGIDGLASHPGEFSIFLVAKQYIAGNRDELWPEIIRVKVAQNAAGGEVGFFDPTVDITFLRFILTLLRITDK